MFQSKNYLEKHTGRFGSERASYLQMLVTEFQDTANGEFKEQILANLANFSYDPINYEWLRQLNVIDLFLDMITEPADKIVEFAMAGICNLCCDRLNQEVIIKNNGITAIKKCLSSSNEETVLSAITTLYFLVNPKTRADILTKGVLNALQAYSHAPSVRLKNISKVFIEQHGHQPQQQQQQPRANNNNYANYYNYDPAAMANYNAQYGANYNYNYDPAAYANYDPAAYAAYYGAAAAAGYSADGSAVPSDASSSSSTTTNDTPASTTEAPAAQ